MLVSIGKNTSILGKNVIVFLPNEIVFLPDEDQHFCLMKTINLPNR